MHWGLFHLSYGDIKLLLAATGTRLSGSVIAAILQGTFVPNDLDFYCPRGSADDAMVFMRDVCAYHLSFEASRDYDDVFGIRRVLTLRNAFGEAGQHRGDLFRLCFGCNSRFFIRRLPGGAISWDRFSHFEINRVRKGVALATPSSMRLAGNTLEGQVQMWRILHKYQGRGFVFEYDHPLPHECGVHIDCPATLRTIDDDGCLHIDLLPSTIPRLQTAPLHRCSLGPLLLSAFVNLDFIYSYQYQIFRRLAAALLKMPRPPVNLLEVTPWDDMDYILTFNGDEDDNDDSIFLSPLVSGLVPFSGTFSVLLSLTVHAFQARVLELQYFDWGIRVPSVLRLSRSGSYKCDNDVDLTIKVLLAKSNVFYLETGRPLHIAVLKDPELNEAISAIYQNQVAVLRSIIRVDDKTMVWTLASSDWSRDVGQVVELEVKLTRFEDDSSGNISRRITGVWDLSHARRIFTACDAERDPHHPILANDQVGVHYIVTRDKTMTDVCGSLDRYSYKELFYPETYERYLSPYRIRVPRYRPSFIGTVVGSELAYHDNPHMAETSGCYCNRIILKCPVGADEATVQLFDKQVRVLEEIIEYDGQESPGKVLVGWTRTLKDGAKAIEVWTSLNDGGVHFDYPVGRDIELVVNLCKDEASDGSCPGNIAKVIALLYGFGITTICRDADVGAHLKQ
ncbi:hypothetical protein R3P38DRAFT_2761696 [Favolaschia claudopus]|uniref:Uncharacterized protein n=1 Tax=Favolaschia claudopus TaxID=2862362 RepID=A0AAW0DQG1_9AGAR